VLVGTYSENRYLTPYVRFGYLFPWACLMITATLLAVPAVSRLRERNPAMKGNHNTA
jgi:hypothetical protein